MPKKTRFPTFVAMALATGACDKPPEGRNPLPPSNAAAYAEPDDERPIADTRSPAQRVADTIAEKVGMRLPQTAEEQPRLTKEDIQEIQEAYKREAARSISPIRTEVEIKLKSMRSLLGSLPKRREELVKLMTGSYDMQQDVAKKLQANQKWEDHAAEWAVGAIEYAEQAMASGRGR